jgi:hypothetical protein
MNAPRVHEVGIPTEPVGSIPRPPALLDAVESLGPENVALDPMYEEAIRMLLNSFIDLNNLALSRFTPAERAFIGVHTCPGGNLHSTHSADVDYAELLPSLFELKAGNVCVALAGESGPRRVLRIIRTRVLGTAMAARELGAA